MKLIDKDALVAEIKRRRKEVRGSYYNTALSDYSEFAEVAIKEQMRQYDSLLSFLNTLEVKEVDIDKEVDDVMKRFLGNITCREEQLKFAKHFFELGLKAQKGE